MSLTRTGDDASFRCFSCFSFTSLLPAARKLLRFEQYTSTRLLAQFDEDLPQIQKISMRISTGNVIGPRYKIRLLRIRFTPLDRPERWEQNPPEEEDRFCPLRRKKPLTLVPLLRSLMCRFDVIMEENVEVAFRPSLCDSHL